MNFPSLRLEGSILSSDLVDAIAGERKHSQKPADFGLESSARVKDEIANTWAAAKMLWATYQSRIEKLKDGQSGASETRNLFIQPFLSLLGYTTEKTEAETVNEKSYAISHRDPTRDGFPIHIMGWHDSLDAKRASSGPRMSPHALVQEYLNLTEHLYALVSNGRQLRVLRDSSRLIKLSFLEFDFIRMFEEDLYADFAILYRLIHVSRMPANRAHASGAILEKYHQDSVDSGSRIREGLATAVAGAMQSVANGLLANDANAELIAELRDDPAKADELHQNLLRWIYRTLFVLVIEERGLNHAPDATLKQRRIYRDYYSLQRLRRLADRPQLADRRSHDLWRAMHQTLRLYEDGGKGMPLGVAPLGSFLFQEDGLDAIFRHSLDNRSLLQALNRLSSFVPPGSNNRMRVNYGALDVEEFGSVYESLLELRPRILPDGDCLTFAYAQLAGNERKTTGSYYTPDSLVQCLLDSALNPVIEDRLAGCRVEKGDGEKGEARRGARSPDSHSSLSVLQEEALLAIKVCDPAVGSGHFLIGAAHRLAQKLAEIRAGDEALSPDAQRRALRDVVTHCLYGVDINPLSVELCKVSLWMLGMEPGKPLGFLDHHIKCGNSLLGATPEAIASGLPDGAFKPIEGDDKKYCADFKKENKKESKNIRSEVQGSLFDREMKPWERLGNLPEAIAGLDAMDDDTPNAVKAKADAYEKAVKSSGYLNARFLHDAWCAAFVWKKCKPEDGGFDYPITNDILQRIERNPRDCPLWMREEIVRLAGQYQFFHWHLSFSEVFANGGFDCLLGNPPWERIALQEKEWFAERHPAIAGAANAARRKSEILKLRIENVALWELWQYALRQADGQMSLLRNSGRFPLCGRGDVNTYSIFTELNRSLIGEDARVGVIVPTGIATDATTQLFFKKLMTLRSLVCLFGFENEGRLFEGVDHRVNFCLLVFGGSEASDEAEFSAFLRHPDLLQGFDRRYNLSADDIALLNPNTHTCPVFRSARDAEITKAVYRRVPVLSKEDEPVIDPWSVRFRSMFHMSGDSGLFHMREALEASGWKLDGNIFVRAGERMLPLYEAKMTYHFNHRFGDFGLVKPGERAHILPTPSNDHLSRCDYVPIPRYWVDEKEVAGRIDEQWGHQWLVGWRDVTDPRSSVRTVVPCIIPRTAVSGKFPILLTKKTPTWYVYAVLTSYALDYVARQKLGGVSLSMFVMRQLPILPPPGPCAGCAWIVGDESLEHWLVVRILELTYTSWDLEPFANDCGFSGPPFCWDEERRFLLRCELDAAFFNLYLSADEHGDWKTARKEDGCPHDETPEQLAVLKCHFPMPRDAVSYIMDTFPIVRKKDEKAHGHYRTKDTILEIYDAMQESIRTGQPYQTRLDPQPASFRVAHPPRLPKSERVALDSPEKFLLVFVHSFLRQTQGEATLELLDSAFHLLRHRESHAGEFADALGDDAQAWLAAFNDEPPNSEFLPFLKRLESDRWISADAGTGSLAITGEFPDVPVDEWRNYDVSAALRVIVQKPEIVTLVLEEAESPLASVEFAKSQMG